jgi:hypothetical protein
LEDNPIDPAQIRSTLAGFNTFHPIGRIGQPADIASIIRFCFSDSHHGLLVKSGMPTAV